jgi:hypothetical protein
MPEVDPNFDISRICACHGHSLELPQIANLWSVQTFILCSGHSHTDIGICMSFVSLHEPSMSPVGTKTTFTQPRLKVRLPALNRRWALKVGIRAESRQDFRAC